MLLNQAPSSRPRKHHSRHPILMTMTYLCKLAHGRRVKTEALLQKAHLEVPKSTADKVGSSPRHEHLCTRGNESNSRFSILILFIFLPPQLSSSVHCLHKRATRTVQMSGRAPPPPPVVVLIGQHDSFQGLPTGIPFETTKYAEDTSSSFPQLLHFFILSRPSGPDWTHLARSLIANECDANKICPFRPWLQKDRAPPHFHDLVHEKITLVVPRQGEKPRAELSFTRVDPHVPEGQMGTSLGRAQRRHQKE